MATDVGMRHGIVVPVEPGVGRLADDDRGRGRQRERVIRQGRKARRLEGERFTHAHGLAGTRPIGGWPFAPSRGLGVEIVDIFEGARGEEIVADVANGPLHAALLVASGDAYGARFEPISRGERQKRGVEADRIALAFEDGALEIVVENDSGNRAERRESQGVAGEERIDPGVEEEAQEHPARVAQHHHEGH